MGFKRIHWTSALFALSKVQERVNNLLSLLGQGRPSRDQMRQNGVGKLL
jgi:hypothetical protein